MPSRQPPHRISAVSPEERTGICSVCGPVRVKPRYGPQAGQYRCNETVKAHHTAYDRRRGRLAERLTRTGRPAQTRNRHKSSKKYREAKSPTCNRCGFVPEDPRQLDVDHRDGDWRNSEPGNLWTLCANCHRLKTFGVAEFADRP